MRLRIEDETYLRSKKPIRGVSLGRFVFRGSADAVFSSDKIEIIRNGVSGAALFSKV